MLRFFTKENPQPEKAERNTKEVIEEIHETFYTEVYRLLADAKIEKSLETDKQGLIDKRKRLIDLGFKSTQEVLEAEKEINRLNGIKKENDYRKELFEAIEYFSFKYPSYKFITEESVKRICEKYNLVYGAVSKYKGTVPDRNLKHIEDFSIDRDDACYLHVSQWTNALYVDKTVKPINRHDYLNFIKYHKKHSLKIPGMIEWAEHSPLEIAAPLSDFDMTESEIKNFKVSPIEIPDPIVLQPVIFKYRKHYLIVTAWGLESEDELVVNPINN